MTTRSATSAPTQPAASIENSARMPLDRRIDADLHQQQRDGHVEHQPHHAARMAVRQAREEIRPGDRAGIGVGDVDLELRDDHQQPGRRQCRPGRAGRRRRPCGTSAPAGSRAPRGTPARSASKARNEPASSFSTPSTIQPGPAADQRASHQRQRCPGVALRQEAQVIDLLADLRDQRERSPRLRRRTAAVRTRPPRPTRGTPPSRRDRTWPRAVSDQKRQQVAAATRPAASNSWKRLITVMPCVTIGITTTAAST